MNGAVVSKPLLRATFRKPTNWRQQVDLSDFLISVSVAWGWQFVGRRRLRLILERADMYSGRCGACHREKAATSVGADASRISPRNVSDARRTHDASHVTFLERLLKRRSQRTLMLNE